MTHDQHRVLKPSFRRAAPIALVVAALVLSVAQSLAAQTLSYTNTVNAPPGVLISVSVHVFDDAGTNPRFTAADFSTMDYYDAGFTGISTIGDSPGDRIFVQAKTADELNALASPPDSPFTVTADVTMTNDEGHTATGTLTFETSYVKAAAPPVQPTLRPATPGQSEERNAPPGILISATAAGPANGVFDNAGTNPRITGATFSTTEYYNTHTVRNDRLWIEAKTADELNALPTPPDSPFRVTVNVTMSNDEGQTATATLSYKTSYDRVEPEPEPTPAPTFWPLGFAPLPGQTLTVFAAGLFRNPGTNPRYTEAVFSTTDYYNIHEIRSGNLVVQPKTEAELNALASPPDSPFTVTADVTMTNDEGHTASGTIQFTTNYEKAENGETEDPPEIGTPQDSQPQN